MGARETFLTKPGFRLLIYSLTSSMCATVPIMPRTAGLSGFSTT
jgi:hypothetical protein